MMDSKFFFTSTIPVDRAISRACSISGGTNMDDRNSYDLKPSPPNIINYPSLDANYYVTVFPTKQKNFITILEQQKI